MPYLIKLPDFTALETLFANNGYHITCDLANELMIYRNNDTEENEENFVEDYTTELPQFLQDAIDTFVEKNNLY